MLLPSRIHLESESLIFPVFERTSRSAPPSTRIPWDFTRTRLIGACGFQSAAIFTVDYQMALEMLDTVIWGGAYSETETLAYTAT